jgi:hypothetical protein
MILRRPPRLALLVGLAAMAGAPGCGSGPAKGDVAGTIKLRGRAPQIEGLHVSFMDAEGVQVSAPIALDGTYAVSGVPAGEVRVCFVYISPEFAGPHQNPARSGPRLAKPGARVDSPIRPTSKSLSVNPIPEPLRDFGTSRLTLKVEPDRPNVFNYDLP